MLELLKTPFLVDSHPELLTLLANKDLELAAQYLGREVFPGRITLSQRVPSSQAQSALYHWLCVAEDLVKKEVKTLTHHEFKVILNYLLPLTSSPIAQLLASGLTYKEALLLEEYACK